MSRDYKHKQSPASGAAPGWVWLMVGLIIGLAVAVAVHLRSRQVVPPTATTNPNTPEDASAELDSDASEFTFYDILPNFEVVIPEEETAIGAGGELAPLVQPGLYVLQAGSFQQEEDADGLRAQLALLGIESGIQRVIIGDDQTWYRVRIGPMSDLDSINRIRERLRSESIEPLLLRVGD